MPLQPRRGVFPKLVFPEPTSEVGLLDQTLQFLEQNIQGSGLELLPTTLLKLRKKRAILVRDLGMGKLGGYNRLSRKIILNSSKFGFLKRDFSVQIRALVESGAPPERVSHIKDQHARAVIELSGVLVHEASHASRFRWSRAADETSAFRAEQQWYYHLHTRASAHREAIAQLARDAEYDSLNSPAYRGLAINAPSLIY